MSSFRVFDIAGSAMSAQSVRLNTVASNLANADAVTSDPGTVYKQRLPIFKASAEAGSRDAAGVQVLGIVESQAPAVKRFQPGHPLADSEGYVYASNVNVVEEMTNMISASRSYQSDVDIINTSKSLLLKTLDLGK